MPILKPVRARLIGGQPVPTHEETKRFNNEFNRLRPDKQALFNQARKEWLAALKAHQSPPARLGIRRFLSIEGMYEFHYYINPTHKEQV